MRKLHILSKISVTLAVCVPLAAPAPTAEARPAPGQSPEEIAGRPAVKLAAQAIRGIYQFYGTGGPDGRLVQFQNVNANKETLEARFFDAGTKIKLIEMDKVSLPHRRLTTWEPPAGKSAFLLALYRKNAFCSEKEVSAPAIINITKTCVITVQPIKQSVPSALAPYRVTNFVGRYKAHPEKLSYLIAQTPTHLLIAFLGTQHEFPENIAMNLNAAPVPTNAGFTGVPTHRGWATAVDRILPLIESYVRQWRGTRALYITGFSMGGAVSGHLTYRLMDAGHKGTVRLVTFGAPRYALQKFKDEFYIRAKRIGFEGYSVEFPNDPKLLDWQTGVEAIDPTLRMDVLRIGHVVDYSCGETQSPSSCQNDPHDHKVYAHVAERRYALQR